MSTDGVTGIPGPDGRSSTAAFLRELGVDELPPMTTAFDPGYDPVTLEAHLEQSAAFMELLKLSMACWIIAAEDATRRKLDAAKRAGVRTVTGGGPFEISAAGGKLERYLDLCAGLGFDRIEAGEGFTDLPFDAATVGRMTHERGLDLQFELGKKHGGAFDDDVTAGLIAQGHEWLSAGASQLVVEARESAQGVGVFDERGAFNGAIADRFADAFGLDVVIFEAPNKASQFALMDHFGSGVRLCNVRLEEILRVEIYRRGLHSDAFGRPNLRPGAASSGAASSGAASSGAAS